MPITVAARRGERNVADRVLSRYGTLASAVYPDIAGLPLILTGPLHEF